MKKASLVLLSGIMSVTMLAGCGSNSNNGASGNNASNSSGNSGTNANAGSNNASTNQSSAEPVTIKYVLPGTEPKEWKSVQAEVNKKLLADGVGVQIDKEYIDWGAWEQKINLKLSTNEDFDMFHVMNDWVGLANYAGRGALKDITKEIEEYGPNLKKIIPESVWSGVTKDGKVYGIPAYWYESAVDGSITLNKYLFNKAGVSTDIKNRDQLLDAMEQINSKLNMKLTIPLRGGSAGPADIFQRTYDAYPFTVRDNVAFIGQDGVVKNWVESDMFKQDAQWFRKAYQKKLINPDVLTVKQEQIQDQIKYGKYAFVFGTPNSLNDVQKTYPDAKDEDFSLLRLSPEKDTYRMVNAKNVNVVAANSKHPAEVVKFLNWLYASQDNYDLFMYGIEGKTYNKVGDKGLESIMDPKTNTPLYLQDDWMIGNLNLIRVNQTLLSANKELYKEDKSAKTFYAANFFFDPAPVKAEMGNVQAVYTSDVTPIYRGVIDYDSHIQAALDKLKAAGIDKVLAEYQKQLDAFKASAPTE
ncbi:carbohydrate ABC transporter substrate-binding protein (CUT1 family) [Paenibacillus taihuensis]|uniref:Carbohydrate ABC transporter substrate-binding protein (CUT1 family) n=1 Tax=Paenibacillus taihuensis TaxID=1156355 RepID=A0A3D9Q0D1_9BACL|nr:extracellular solute-binding protein [Paenibacillus taihuensis]REE56269.1 carbohydrate ABC transporter substrate-binding protein (CUT1 family) [Paenibacillus taihuensis]